MRNLLQQFINRRFGIFIHYGLYSIPGGVWKGKAQGRNAYAEWIKYQALWPEGGPIPDEEYDALADKFTAEEFDPAEWAREIRNAGAGYVVITTKHHDGFAMYDSAVSDYNIVRKTPFGRDLIGEFGRGFSSVHTIPTGWTGMRRAEESRTGRRFRAIQKLFSRHSRHMRNISRENVFPRFANCLTITAFVSSGLTAGQRVLC